MNDRGESLVALGREAGYAAFYRRKQESLASAKVSARQPWYIGHNSLNRPSLGNAEQYQRNLDYTSLKSTSSAQQFRR